MTSFNRDYETAQRARLQDALHADRLNQIRNQGRGGVWLLVGGCLFLWGLFFYIGLHL